MRKTLLIFSMVAAMAVGANAQTGNARFGIKVGPTFDGQQRWSLVRRQFGFGLRLLCHELFCGFLGCGCQYPQHEVYLYRS